MGEAMKSVQNLWGKHSGEVGYIVGRGPSVINIKADDLGPGPIITLNHAIHYVEALDLPNPVYSMQKDGCDINERGNGLCKYDCHTRPHGPTGMGGYPKKAALLLSWPESWICYPESDERYVFDVQMDCHFEARAVGSLPVAAKIIQLMGVKEVKILCCDSIDGEYRSAYNDKRLGIALDWSNEKMLAWYRSSAQRAQEALDVPFEWVTI